MDSYMKKIKFLLLISFFAGFFISGCNDNSSENPVVPGENLSSSDENTGSSNSGDPSIDPGSSSSDLLPANSSASGNSSSPAGTSSSAGTSFSSSSAVSNSSSSESIPPGTYPKLTTSNAESGYGTRYWDGCKPSCTWPDNAWKNRSGDDPNLICKNCDINNNEVRAYYWHTEWNKYHSDANSCEGGSTYTCFDMAPVAVNDTLAYGFAATAGGGENTCGKCYQIQFDGKGKYDTKAAHSLLNGKTMIVMASNVGYDVGSGHFDILIPGGGVGLYDSFSKQLGVSNSNLGKQYGGLLSTCQDELGHEAAVSQYKTCVMDKCNALFGGDSKYSDLLRGCRWFVDWFETADNPTFLYKEVECPAYLTNKYRSSVN